MANLGGGAEAHARFKQYEYRANSSLVLTTDSRPRDTHEPTGEPETLWGRIDKKNFGDRAVQAKPPELEERLTKSRKKKERDAATAGDRDAADNLPRKRRRRAAAQRAHSARRPRCGARQGRRRRLRPRACVPHEP